MAPSFTLDNHATLRGLFKHLNVPFSETDRQANATVAQQLWVTEHREINTRYTDEQLLEVLKYAEQLGLLGEYRQKDGRGREYTYLSRMNNPGGTRRAMIKRFRLYEKLTSEGKRLGNFLCWGGQRLRDLKVGETLKELVAFIHEENPAALNYKWVKDQLALDDENPDRYQRPFATETEILILCAYVVYGRDLRLSRTVYTDEKSQIEGVPDRKVVYYVFSRYGGSDIIILNGAAVRRYNGKGEEIEPRPTMESTGREVRRLFGFNGRQGLMVSNPHSFRLAAQAEEECNKTFIVYGLPAPDAPQLADKIRQAKTVLGEVARTLYVETIYGRV